MRTRTVFLSVVLLATFAARALAQPAPAAAEKPATPAQATPAPAAPAVPAVVIKDSEPHASVATKTRDAAGRDTLSVDFPDEDIRTIVRNVADLFELNLVMPETLQGKTSIKLRDVTWRQIFQNVLAPVGYTYIEDGNIIKIISNESLTQEPTSTEVFILNYAKASDVLPTLSALVDGAAGGKIVVDARSNSLVITERPSRMNRIRPILEQLDRATDQVMIETKFIEVTDGDVRNLGLNWSTLKNYKLGALPSGQVDRSRGQTTSDSADTTNGNTGSNGTTNNVTQNQTATNSANVAVANGVPTSTSSSGNTSSLSNVATSAISNTATTALSLLSSIANTGGTTRTSSVVFSADQFGVVISALNELSSTKVVSNPTIVTLNNTEATINVGEEDPIPSYSYNEQRGSFEVSNFVYKPIGINLKVTPQVNARGFIKLSVSPEVSQKNGSVNFGGAGGASIPIIATRKATTNVSLKDGYTMGIGGLLTSQTTNGNTKIPVLGDIPVLGYLFKQKSKNLTSTNLLIFITARSVSADGAPIEQVFDPRQIRSMGVTRDELPGYRDGSDPFAVPPTATKHGKTK